jgi:hypothetical protein
MGLSKAIAHTWVGIVISIGLIAYAAMNWIRRQSLPAAEREEEDTKRKAAGDGLTPLMHAAASGDTSRVRESLDYGADANAVSLIGTTALMYAARNNQLDIARLLVDAGADVGIRSDKGSTAVDIAQRTGNAELSKLLSASSKRQK